MLTLVEAMSLAGDRAKQNDDACFFAGARAWVIDGATDLHDAPLTGWASDVSWVAHTANAALQAHTDLAPREAVRAASVDCAGIFTRIAGAMPEERWKRPIGSMLLAQETAEGIEGLDLGDCRAFALDANGQAHAIGGPEDAAEDETALAAQQTDAHKPLLRRTETIDMLRRMRSALNQEGAAWTFGLDPRCADHARTWAFALARPAHVLLMTDGFSALTDRYGIYDAGALVQAAVDKGLHELGRELRAIENADAGGETHPRFKKSDDATALLLRLT